MNYTSKIQHKCSVDAEISHTSFEWALNHWSLLLEDYEKGVTSPRFDILQTDGCKCELIFEAKHYPQRNKHDKRTSRIKVNFFGTLKYLTLQAKVSIIGKNVEKLCVKQENRRRIESVNESLLLIFDDLLTKEVVAPFIENDTLKLLFELYLVKGMPQGTPIRTNTWNSNQALITRKRVKKMFKSGELCDFTFTVRGHFFPVHKIVLAANSEVFQDMFQSLADKPQIRGTEIEDVDPEVFKTFLNYIYTGEIEQVGESMINNLMAFAERYQLIELMEVCETHMKANLKIKQAEELELELSSPDE